MMVTPLRRRESFSVWFGDLLFSRSSFGYKFTLDWEIKVFKLLCPYLLNAIDLRHYVRCLFTQELQQELKAQRLALTLVFGVSLKTIYK